MEEVGFITKLALSGLVVFGIGFFMLIIYMILEAEDIIDYDIKWPGYVANYSMAFGIVTMILSLFLYIWS